jgi:catechol 2,3-dioxygenase-like lactoylglutathione lyase family enzyme
VGEGPGAWTVDKEVNKLGNTSLSPLCRVNTAGWNARTGARVNSWDLLAAHIDLTVDGNVSALLDKLEGLNMLVMPEVNGLPNPRRQEGFRRFAFIQDPDGLVLEYFSKPVPKPGDPPAPPTVSNSSATGANMDRLGKQAGFNHYAYNITDPRKAQDFYVKVLGGDYPPIESTSGAQVMLHGWFPQATTNNSLRVELVYFALNKGKTPPVVKFQDINANYGGFQTSNIEAAYARAKANGAVTVSDGGIVDYHKGRAVLMRDPDVGGYIMLWQPAK